MDNNLFFQKINKKHSLSNHWTEAQWLKILDTTSLSSNDLGKIEYLRNVDHSVNITDSFFKASLTLSYRFNNIIVYKNLPIFFDLKKLNLFRYSATFYGFYYDKRQQIIIYDYQWV